jgi:hypothetical protein
MKEVGMQCRALRSCLLLTALALLLSPSHAQTDPAGILWQSRNITYNALDSEFAGFWRGVLSMMLDGAKLPTTTAIIPKGKLISEVLRERGLYDGKDMPRQLDILICLLNEQVCKTTKGKDGDLRAPDASARWTIQPNAEIVVPDVKFEPLVIHKPYQKKAGETLEDIVAQRQGCEQYDAACERYVMNLNRRLEKPLDRSYTGRIIVPTKAYRAVIPVLATRAVSPAKVELRSAPAQAPIAAAQTMDRARLLHAISHPLAKVPNLAFPGTAHSTVAVLDSWVDPKHCMLGRVQVWDPEKLGGLVNKATDCGESGASIRATDHGTHVVGLIGASLGAKAGPGINPYADIHALCMDESQFTSPLYISNLMTRLLALYKTDPPDVVNMSFAYRPLSPGLNDVLLSTIQDAQDGTVFVAAAGNDKIAMSRDGACTVAPACYDLPNVIVVAALDQNVDEPKLWSESTDGADGSKAKGSNYGDRVHIAAPGEGILSTISGDRIGTFDGTSQAAPLVAGAISLLYQYSSKHSAPAVKDRTIYTSDLFSSLYDKMRGGRLNVTRLLEVKRAIVETRGGTRILAEKRPQNQLVTFTEIATERPIPVRFAQIRRMKFNADLNNYTLFYYEDETGPLQRAFVTLQGEKPTLNFSIEAPGGALRNEPIAIADIVDYTSPMR